MTLANASTVRRVVLITNWLAYVDSSFGLAPGGSTSWLNELGEPASPARVDSAFKQLASDVARMRRSGKDVVILLTDPWSEAADPALIAKASRIPFVRPSATHSVFLPSFPLAKFKADAHWIESEVAMAAQLGGARLIDPAPYLCPNGACPTMDERGALLRSDEEHLRPFASIRYLTFVPSLLAPQSAQPQSANAPH